ncbi:hypothetical protein [Alterisphingorhabdus coralli]|uniref:T6SS immunity protein Tdi1 C-terminal domain-containing protein n=1 Tax=Alterisphingorhabdus coralli TaxID=3071408 RepID=A0AA97I0A7_9SPHN|nr:hypothetical protein [Parasphingorhabdus sp. SCSIO 66989]WOE73980.1 hypothetical protein RB602_08890 [Parasphingorhabdus sp. SCSIO 66989]
MPLKWENLAFQPDKALSEHILSTWEWLLASKDVRPFLCSVVGDCFLANQDGKVLRLCCTDGTLEIVSNSRGEFDDLCREFAQDVELWFLPDLVLQAHKQGKIAKKGQCYQFIILPIFAECEFHADNLGVVPASELYTMLSDVHKQLKDLPEGAEVQLKLID